MIKRVTSGVQQDTLRAVGRRQTPFVYSSFTGDFCFAGCAPKVDAAEVDRLIKDRANLEQQLKNRSVADPAKSDQRPFIPPNM